MPLPAARRRPARPERATQHQHPYRNRRAVIRGHGDHRRHPRTKAQPAVRDPREPTP